MSGLLNPKPIGDIERTAGSSKQQTTEQIMARGEVGIRIKLIRLVSGILLILTIRGVAAFYFAPDRWKDFWVVIGPIISGAVAGCLGFIAGDKRPFRKR